MATTIYKNEERTLKKIVEKVKQNGKKEDSVSGYMLQPGRLKNNQRCWQKADVYSIKSKDGYEISLDESDRIIECTCIYNENSDQVSISFDKRTSQIAYYLHSGPNGHNLMAIVDPEETEIPIYDETFDKNADQRKLRQKSELSDTEIKDTVRETIEETILKNSVLQQDAYKILEAFDQILSLDDDRKVNHRSPEEIELAEIKTRVAKLERENFRLEEENSRLEGEKSQLEGENSRLEGENSQLKKDKNKLQEMLSRALEFIQKVKDSVVGKIFFKKPLKQLNENNEMLDK